MQAQTHRHRCLVYTEKRNLLIWKFITALSLFFRFLSAVCYLQQWLPVLLRIFLSLSHFWHSHHHHSAGAIQKPKFQQEFGRKERGPFVMDQRATPKLFPHLSGASCSQHSSRNYRLNGRALKEVKLHLKPKGGLFCCIFIHHLNFWIPAYLCYTVLSPLRLEEPEHPRMPVKNKPIAKGDRMSICLLYIMNFHTVFLFIQCHHLSSGL